ncbi:hypothetical protein ES703_21932 [subsurface metagenome]
MKSVNSVNSVNTYPILYARFEITLLLMGKLFTLFTNRGGTVHKLFILEAK